ncbi:MAG TPA: TlpA disulfide reductase family protein, partial [Urbifossiella sp.]
AAAYSAIQKDWKKDWSGYELARDQAKTAEARKLAAAKTPDVAAFAIRYLKFAEQYPGTNEELIALCWAGGNNAGSDAGQKAIATLAGGRLDRTTPEELYRALGAVHIPKRVDQRPLVPVILAKAKKSLHDPHTARLLAWICVAYMFDDSDKPPEPFTEAADLIVARFSESPYISNFCEVLYLNGGRSWAAMFEKHLRTIVAKNKKPLVRLTSRFALASVVRGKGVDSQREAETLFQQFITEFERKSDVSSELIRQSLLEDARRELKEIQLCGLGKPAQVIDGKDLDGKPLKLADHKGKVVVLVFWASWCGPCLRDVPHEKELVERFKNRPFVLIGVNADDEKDEARKAIAKTGISWRSFADGVKDDHGPIAKAWAVAAWPTVYVIDHTGVIRENRLRGQRLDGPLEALIAEAEKAAKPPKR